MKYKNFDFGKYKTHDMFDLNFRGLTLALIKDFVSQNVIFLLKPISKVLVPFFREYIETKAVQKVYQTIANCGRGMLLKIHILFNFVKNVIFVNFD